MKELLARLLARPTIAAELVAASLLANVLALASPLFVIQVLNRYVAHGVDATLATLTAGVVMAIILELGFRQVRLRLATSVNSSTDETLALDAFAVLTGAKTSALEMLPAGLRREIVSGTDAVESAYSPPNIAAVLDVPFALLFVGVLALINPLLAVIASGFLAMVFVAAMLSLSSTRQPTRELTSVSGRRGALISSALSAPDTVRAFNGAGFMRRMWLGEVRTFQNLRHRITARHSLIQSLTQSAQAVLSVVIIAVGAMLVVAGKMDVGAMIGANILAARGLGPIVKLAQMGEAFSKARQALDMFAEFVKLPQERLQGSALGDYKGGLQLKDVGFAFPGVTTPLFESLSLNLQAGGVLVVTGDNGAGKTTLARLIVGLVEPRRGQVLVDGVDLAQVVPEWWRKQIVYLPQEPRFLNASLRENILAFNPDLDSAGINILIETVGLRRFVDESPDGLDMPITNNGDTLSLGVRRRLALARALATDGMLAVLDEPSEGLDVDGTKRVLAVMNDLAQRGRSIIVFSHDPRIVKGGRFVLDLNAKPVPKLVDMQVAADAQTAAQATVPAMPATAREATSTQAAPPAAQASQAAQVRAEGDT